MLTLSSQLRAAWLVLLLLTLSVTLSLRSAQAQDAKPFLHPLFTDNMVLQRGVSDPVWGWTTPGQSVTVSLDGKSAKAVAGPDGKWMARLGPFKEGGPYVLTVTGPQTATVKNILIGDVWLCSGQSNMSFNVGGATNAPAEIAAANDPQIRLFSVPTKTGETPQSLVSSQWQECTPQTVGGFSAVAYFFGRDLQRDVHVPIGLIHSSWGGTIAEAWTSAQALNTMPDFQPAVAAFQKSAADTQAGVRYQQALAAWYAKHDPGTVASWQDPAQDASAWKTMTLPQLFQDAGDPELVGVNGVIWFRKSFDLPAGDAGKEAVLHLLVDDNDTTWVNGTQVGATDGFTVPRAYKIAASLLKPTGNVVVVRVLDTGGGGGIYGDPAGLVLDVPGETALLLTGPWSYKLGAPLPKDDPLPTAPGSNPNVVTVLYNGMIAPLLPFALKGAIWYQGESNVGRGKQYQTLLPTLIADWRSRFGVGNFPFLIVQLANLGDPPAQPGESGWAELREAQLLTTQHIPKTALAVAMDIGEAHDIHPKNKQEVGRRLALSAEAIAYGEKVEYAGPQYQSMTVEGSAIRLKFSHVGGGLVAKASDVKGSDKLQGFAIAGADGKFVRADARLDGETVVVSSPDVPHPAAVRYAWADNPVFNLYNKAGLPATAFRTDAAR